MDKSTVLVLTPLVSLMVNQVKNLRERCVSAAILSGNDGVDKDLQAATVKPGLYSLLYTAPEAVVDSIASRW